MCSVWYTASRTKLHIVVFFFCLLLVCLFDLRWNMCTLDRISSTIPKPRWEIDTHEICAIFFQQCSITMFLSITCDRFSCLSHLARWLLFSWFLRNRCENPIIDYYTARWLVAMNSFRVFSFSSFAKSRHSVYCKLRNKCASIGKQLRPCSDSARIFGVVRGSWTVYSWAYYFGWFWRLTFSFQFHRIYLQEHSLIVR